MNTDKTLYLPNSVDISRYKNTQKYFSKSVNIGYVGMLETYGVKKYANEALNIILNGSNLNNVYIEEVLLKKISK